MKKALRAPYPKRIKSANLAVLKDLADLEGQLSITSTKRKRVHSRVIGQI